jgi:Diacylglycerol kinase catalytic domain
VLFVNPRSGDGTASRHRVAERARERGIEAVILGPGQNLAELTRAAVTNGADALGVAGGDGSLAVVAAAAAAHDLPFVCIPAGTRNHFALDVGVDRQDVPGAIEAFTSGVERRIDMADVNGRLYLNNVSLGIYGDAVRRPGYRDAKVRTLLETAQAVLGPSGQVPPLRLVDDAGREHRQPAVVLVSNNPYAVDRPPPAAPAPRSTPAGSGLSCSMHLATARPSRGGPGPRQTWRSVRPPRCTRVSTVRLWSWARRCGSPSGPPRYACGSPPSIQASHHPHGSRGAARDTGPGLPGRCHAEAGPGSGRTAVRRQ